MSLLQFFSILRARRGIAGIILFATVALALAWVSLRPPNYMARAPVLVDVRTDPVGNTPLQGVVSPSFMSTQIDIVRSDRVAERVLKMLPPDQPPVSSLREEAQRQRAPQAWTAHQIQQRLEVKPARESNMINIAWTGRSPAEAARVANAFAQAYLDTYLELKTDPAKKYADWFEDQVKSSRETLEKAHAKLSAFQQQAGIVSADEHGDYETARLTDLSEQLVLAQSRRRGVSGDASVSAQSPLVDNLRADIARLDGKVHEAQATMGPRHPYLQRLQAELAALNGRLASETARAGASAGASAQAARERERELQKALSEQKTRVLALTEKRGELNLLQRDVEAAQKAYEAVAAGAAQSRLQSVTNQTNVMRLAPAAEPVEATGPTRAQALMIAGIAGIVLAIAGALLMELINRRVRSADDLSMVTELPILAVVPAAASVFVPLRLASTSRRLSLASGRSPT